jgi:uncharacterized protein (DUF433 family)
MEVDWSDCPLVEVVPGKLSGLPVIRGTRVRADTVPESEELGETPEEIAYNYDLNPADVRRLLAYAARHHVAPAS